MADLCKWREAPCQREIYYLSRGLCARHYALARRRGILAEEYPKPVMPAVCKAENCTRPRVTKGYCHGHYVHYEYRGHTGPMGPPKHFLSDVDLDDETATCAVCGLHASMPQPASMECRIRHSSMACCALASRSIARCYRNSPSTTP